MRIQFTKRVAAVTLALSFITASALAMTQEPRPAQQVKPTPAADTRAEALKKYLEAQRLEQSGNYAAAVTAYKEAVGLDPASAELRIALGTIYLKNRNVIDAEAEAREAIKLAPNDINAHKLTARIYLEQSFVGTSLNKDKARAAIKQLEEIVKMDSGAKVEVNETDKPVPALTLIGQLYYSLDEDDKALEAFRRVAEAGGSTDLAHFQLASLLYQKNKFREAAAAARKAYEMNQKSPQYAAILAKSLLRIGRTQEALEIYKKAMGATDASAEDKNDALLKGIPNFSPLTFDYAEALVYAGRYDEATKLLDPMLKALRKDSPAYLSAIRITVDAHRRAGRREEAVRTLEDSLKGQDVSESLPVLYSLAETYEEMEKFDKAIESYEEALAAIVNPDGTVGGREQDKQSAGVVLRRIALAHRMAGRRDKAMETFERVRKVLGPESPLADQLIIDTLLNEGKNKEAFDAASGAVKRFADDRLIKFYLAQSAGKLGDMRTAEATLNGLLKNSQEDADIYLFLSSVQLEANLLKQAEESVRKAIGLEPNDIGPLITLSIIQERQRKVKESEATLRKALEIDPDNATVLNNLGYFLTERNEKMQEAEDLIRRAVNIEPTNGSFLDSLGWLLFKQGKLQEAQKYLEQAVIYSPRSATIHDHLGDLYKKQGQADKAQAKWEEGLRLATEPDEIKKIKEKLGKK